MNARHPQALVAALATILGATPLMACFSSLTWLFYAGFAVIGVVGSAMAVRALRAPSWVQVLTMTIALVLYLTLCFPSGAEIVRIVPTADTVRHFNDLLVTAGQSIRDERAPVSDSDGLLFLATLGVGLVALVVDITAVAMRRPALAGLAMLAIYSVPVAVLVKSVPVLFFILAAVGFLWLLVSDSVDRVRRFGRRFTGEGRDVELWESSPLASAGRRLSVVGIVLAILVPLVVPGMTSGLIDRFSGGIGPGEGNGSGTNVNLNALLTGALNSRDPVTMLRLQTDNPRPHYLRIGVADQVTEDGFTNSMPTTGTNIGRELLPPAVPQFEGVTAGRYHAQVEIVNMSMGLAPLYPELASISGLEGSWLFDDETQQVFSQTANINQMEYSFDYVQLSYTAASLRRAGSFPPAEPAIAAMTEAPDHEEITQLVAGLTSGQPTEYDRVRAIYEYFHSGDFVYSLQTEPGSYDNALLDFLETKRGFCVQYAAAMAWLVRVAGYPARVAFGFTRGIGPVGGTYSLTNLNLHAWTEVYFNGIGWVPFDSTPIGAVTGAVSTPWATEPIDSIDPGITPVDPTQGEDPFPQPTDQAAPDQTGGPGPSQQSPLRPWMVIVAIAGVLIAMLVAPALARRRLRRRRRARGGELVVVGAADGVARGAGGPRAGSAAGRDGGVDVPDDSLVFDERAVATARRDAREAWAELLDTMVDYDVPVHEAETPRATVTRLTRRPGLARVEEPAALLGQAEERARYARHPMQARRLDEANAYIRRELARVGTRRQRLRAVLFPPSVLWRWRQALLRGVGAAARVASRIRGAIYLINPLRLLPTLHRS